MIAPLLGILKAIPIWMWLVAGLVVWGYMGHRSARVHKQEAIVAKQDAKVANETAKREKEARDEQDRIMQKRASIAEADAAQAAKDRAASVANNLRAVGVLKRVDDLVAASRAGQAASAVPGGAPGDLLGAVLKACINEYRDLGDEAANAARRGKRCEEEYDTNQVKKP